uniref:Alternative protein SVEP1 n=1 Tax=Homo sapiens TaxID=9606 RepID=L8EBF2_HUMAN|nr:alternative protein SVEP1 [Homo sapiens]
MGQNPGVWSATVPPFRCPKMSSYPPTTVASSQPNLGRSAM